MKLRIPILFLVIYLSAVSCASATGWQDIKKQALVAVNSNDCETAWNLIWPWAQRGNLEARAILATSMVVAKLTPPSNSDDAISRFRHFIILAVHGAANGDSAAVEVLYSLIKDKQIMDIGGRKLIRCFDAHKEPLFCVEEAVKDGFIPSFEDYVKEIEIMSKFSNLPRASCKISVGEHDLPTQGRRKN